MSSPAAETIRWRAHSRYSYALALLALVQLARTHEGEPFHFGPLDIDQVENTGIVVSGADLGAVTDTLSGVPGLFRSPD